MNKLYSGQKHFEIVATVVATRACQKPAVFNGKTGLQSTLERDAALAISPMLAAAPVFPAILKTFKNRFAGIGTEQFGRNPLAVVLE